MRSDDEMSEDEEEILVYVEFEGLVDGNVFSETQLQLDMIGIDTEHPIMQINGKFYEGTYEDVIGTCMLFTKNDNAMADDPVFDIAPNFKYFAKTRKFLKMQRIFVKSRTEVLGDSEHDQCIPNLNTLKEAGIPFEYQEKALTFWRTVRNSRLNALYLYLEKQRIRQQKKSEGIRLDSESDEDNPFAIYKHKEDSFKFHKIEDNSVQDEKNLNYCDDKTCLKFLCTREASNNDSLDVRKCSCEKNHKQHPVSSDSESFRPKDDVDRLTKPVKGYKTKVSRKQKMGVACNKKRMKIKGRHTSVTNNVQALDPEEVELSNLEKQMR